jgi:cytoskeletal protein CcmA (bactofilin family)
MPTPHDKVQLTCPHCGHQQLEPRSGISTVCKKCHAHLRVQEVLKPAPKTAEPTRICRLVTCFDCGAELEVPVSAESTMCKRCSRYVDLKDYHITSAISKNFKTKGAFVIETKGYVFNTEIIAGNAVIKGRLLGKINAQTLTLHSTAEIKGSFTTARLIIPAGNTFRWRDRVQVASAEIAGEVIADLRVEGTLAIRSTARLFGDVVAGNMIVEPGAVLVGNLCVGQPLEPISRPVSPGLTRPDL